MLQFNGLDPARGHDAFDLDCNGAVTWSDFHHSAAHVLLPVADQDLHAAAFCFLAAENCMHTYIGASFQKKQFDDDKKHEEKLCIKYGMDEHGQVIRERWIAALGGRSTAAARAFDEIASYLSFFGISPEEGYNAFDSDGDGAISLGDLRDSTLIAGLELAEGELQAAFLVLDPDNTGHAIRTAWSAAVGAADSSYSAD